MMHRAFIQPNSNPLFSPSAVIYERSCGPMAAWNIRCCSTHVSLSTPPLGAVPLPRPMETHLWYVVPDEIKSSSLLNQYWELLSLGEKQNVLSLQDQHQKGAILARALVRTTIVRYQTTSIDPRNLEFKRNSFGKPEVDWHNVPNPPQLHFNISHTSSLIACGVTTHAPIGIDVERKNRTMKNSVMSFARRFFCKGEAEYLGNLLDHEIERQEFLKLWTLKEAYVKALGLGFSAAPFNSFRIHIKPPSDRMSDLTDDSICKVSEVTVESTHSPDCKWQFALLELEDTHYVAICTENSISISKGMPPVGLRVWKTVPFVEDFCMSKTGSVVTIGGFVKQLP